MDEDEGIDRPEIPSHRRRMGRTLADAPGLGPGETAEEPASETQAAERRLLVVEDDPDVGHALAVVAESCGWTVRRAITYREARELLQTPEFTCDVAAIDLHLPDGWGLDLLGALHAPPILCAGIVVITGLAPSPALAADVYARGAACLLRKPTGARAFARALELAHRRSVELRIVAGADSHPLDVDAQSPEDRLFARAADRFLLDDGEVLVVRRLCAERTDREIAAELGVSESALKRTQAGIRAKMGVETRSGVVRKVYESVLASEAAPRFVGEH